jgi:hypothetical protein
MYAVVWWGNLKKRHSMEELGVAERIILICILEKQDGTVWTVFVCLKTGISGWFFRTQMNIQVT